MRIGEQFDFIEEDLVECGTEVLESEGCCHLRDCEHFVTRDEIHDMTLGIPIPSPSEPELKRYVLLFFSAERAQRRTDVVVNEIVGHIRGQ